MKCLFVNLSKLIFDHMTADNFDNKNFLYGMLLTFLFHHWDVDLKEDPFLTPSKPFNRSNINRKLSHTSKSSTPTHEKPHDDEDFKTQLFPSTPLLLQYLHLILTICS